MSLNPKLLLNRHFSPICQTYGYREAILYALAVGLGADPADAQELPFVYEGQDGNALQVVPTLACVLASPGFWMREPDAGIDWQQVVHIEQDITWHRPLPVQGHVVGQNRISGVWDQGAGRGVYLEQQRVIRDAETTEPLCTVTELNLIRDAGGSEGLVRRAVNRTVQRFPDRPADAVCDGGTQPSMALLYRLCGDSNPLHADPVAAKRAGFERPVLHGLAAMGVAAHAVLRSVAGYDPQRFAAMRVRFASPVFPGDTLRTEMWLDGRVVVFRTTAVERAVVVLNHGRVELR